MLAKKVTALLVSAALAVCLLAGCGGKNQSLAQVILNLLDGQYTNVTVEIDPDLEADLRQAVRGAETEAEIRAALENILGPGISFQLLGDGQKGDTAWNLILYPGSDPDAAGRSGFVEWNKVFSALPGDGQYTAQVAMIETDNGYALLVQATVDRAGSRDDDNDEPEEPDEPEDPGYTKTDNNSYTVNTPDGLQNLFTQEWSEASTATITLPAGSYNISSTFGSEDEPFLGTLQGAGKESTTINLQAGSNGLFQQIGVYNDTNGRVENITFNVQTTITNTCTNNYGNIYSGAVAGRNNGTIRNCDVNLTGNSIETNTSSFAYAGGIVGHNNGTITNCTVTGGNIKAKRDGGNSGQHACAGGIVGQNSDIITDNCKVIDTSVTATSTSTSAYAGGLVGDNGGTIEGSCKVENTSVSATGSTNAYAGGLVGRNIGSNAKVTGSYTGNGTISATTEAANGIACAGGVVGYNSGSVTGSYSGNGDNGSIQAKVKNDNGNYDIASVPRNDPTNPNTHTVGNASAGTKIGGPTPEPSSGSTDE